MSRTQFATRVENDEAQVFKETAARLGTTPPDALRMFIAAFNECGGFPFDVRIRKEPEAEAFENEEDATRFATSLAMRSAHEAW